MRKELKHKFKEIKNKYVSGEFNSLEPMLFMLTLNGEIYNLKNHFQFSQVFNLKRPKREIHKCARQVGKSQSICGRNVLASWLIPFYRTLFVLPRKDQAETLSKSIIKPFVEESTFRNLFVDKDCDQGVLFKSYRLSKSKQFFQYALLNADRVRGISNIADLYFDEAQDINWSFIPIIGEVTTASKDYGFINFTGTPKALDNTLAVLWNDSSQAEWITKCSSCNHYNIPSGDEIWKMIGDVTCVCSKCGKPLDCSKGTFIHRYPERIHDFSGYHIPQIIHPMHYKDEMKWKELLYKRKTYDTTEFMNEVLGLEHDSSTKLMMSTDLQKICVSSIQNTLESAVNTRQGLQNLVMGIDWGGGGEKSDSYTALAIGGIIPGNDVIQTIFGYKFHKSTPPNEEISEILKLFKLFNPMFIAHDYGGAGSLRETMLIQAGLPPERIIPYTYVFSPSKAVIQYNAPSGGNRFSYSLDKTRSLMILCAMMKAKKILLPKWETIRNQAVGGVETTLAMDFTHLQEERQTRPGKSDVVLIQKTPKLSDDFAQALNYMASTIWYTKQCYPNLAAAMNIQLSADELAEVTASGCGCACSPV